MESERTHSKKTFIRKMPHTKLIQSHNNIECVSSPIEQRKSDLNVFKMNKISNNIHSTNNNFINKVSKFHYQYDNHKNNITSNLSSNSHKSGFVTMNNIHNINHLKEKNSKMVNKSDLSCDNLIKNPLRNEKFNKLKFTDIKKNKNKGIVFKKKII